MCRVYAHQPLPIEKGPWFVTRDWTLVPRSVTDATTNYSIGHIYIYIYIRNVSSPGQVKLSPLGRHTRRIGSAETCSSHWHTVTSDWHWPLTTRHQAPVGRCQTHCDTWPPTHTRHMGCRTSGKWRLLIGCWTARRTGNLRFLNDIRQPSIQCLRSMIQLYDGDGRQTCAEARTISVGGRATAVSVYMRRTARVRGAAAPQALRVSETALSQRVGRADVWAMLCIILLLMTLR